VGDGRSSRRDLPELEKGFEVAADELREVGGKVRRDWDDTYTIAMFALLYDFSFSASPSIWLSFLF